MQAVFDLLRSRHRPVSLRAILADLSLPEQSVKTVKQELTRLMKSGRVIRQGKKYLARPDSDTVEAVLDVTARGFGFAVVKKPRQRDIFIARRNMAGAAHGDRILVQVIGDSRGRPEGRVVKILQRGFSRLLGIFVGTGDSGYVIPDDDKMPHRIGIGAKRNKGATDGSAVVVDILDYGSATRDPVGRIVTILGDPDQVDTQIRMVMFKHELPASFPADVMAEVEALTPQTDCEPGREDLRHLDHVTIDGETARDFDDAIHVEKRGEGFRLLVSIADVGHYVRPGSALDREAYRRGTSVYLPGRVVPMLPERLSNDLCSLVPGQDRPAFTAILDFDSRGRRTSMRFTKSMITSRTRFTYTTVRRILADRDKDLRHRHRDCLAMLEAASRLTRLLHDRRLERGSLGFVIPQADIRLDDRGRIIDIGHQERNPAHLLIEECMLAANEAVAELLATKKRPVLFRVHEEPEPEKVEEFIKAAAAMGLQLPQPFESSPAWFAGVLERAASSPSAYVINNLLLRTMQRARYSPENLGHFGLAAPYYTHFTSPIRRYPDLIVHRVLQHHLQDASSQLPERQRLEEAGNHLSARERVAVDVERDIHARLSVLFMRDKIGERFEAIISGVSRFALFLELVNHFISGAVPVREMDDDYYIHDAGSHRLIGELHGKIYQLGTIVQVRLVRVDTVKKQLTFTLVD